LLAEKGREKREDERREGRGENWAHNICTVTVRWYIRTDCGKCRSVTVLGIAGTEGYYDKHVD
jgi:hypothetical protein